ncbi:MAG: (d)CMP kinase [Polyangiaceae bacterium]|nr:(d)CMP kinase [Polyangiaceae bacterium]
MRPKPIIAIDGPAGAGKSSVARELARVLGFALVDTGAMYRTLALAAHEAGIAFTEGDAIAELGAKLLADGSLSFTHEASRLQSDGEANGIRVLLRGEDVSKRIRTPEVALGASTVSKFPPVRNVLLGLQRKVAENGGVVLEGRDIGTVVCPDAEVKFFLTARPEIRAQRRFEELQEKGEVTTTLAQTLQEVIARDEQDKNRPVAPLRPADDAVIIDSSDWSLDETIARMLEIAGRAHKA